MLLEEDRRSLALRRIHTAPDQFGHRAMANIIPGMAGEAKSDKS
jgi:hypothetical protein